MEWDEGLVDFVRKADELGVRMVMVGGGAVNYHGYQRHSADVDFWIETSEDNLSKLIQVFKSVGYEIDAFPPTVADQLQNISVKFSPTAPLSLELITRFEIGIPFSVAYDSAEIARHPSIDDVQWKVLNLNDLVVSKMQSDRPKDQLDVQELQRIQTTKGGFNLR